MTVDVEVGAGMMVGAGVKVWVGGAVGDEGGDAEFVPVQAERMIIHTILINFILFILTTRNYSVSVLEIA